ncbi:hypothetical protein LJ656_11615 [Paraburkholderia sp. MMS20-SJTR3]|uniref:PXPV repeat-containing protein n=1 Tax=Paraburkholderia sejongensis TaxID=2886946 RepID=A0ABS8JU18_9BURK|nr:hypothetical protein [Paraburkholderia sp. MMS20-SJTR3]MCC8393240.1 hypothetical protein [Paraburkholderia sp. MMS20-SJTR3]
MKRIVTHLLVAGGLAAGACGVAQAHSGLNVGLSIGAPVYAAPAPVYAAPQPVYYGGWHQRYGRGDYYRDYHRYDRYDRGWGRDDGRWGHGDRGEHRGWRD